VGLMSTVSKIWLSVALTGSSVKAQNRIKLFVAHKMAQNNCIVKKVHEGMTELLQLLIEYKLCLERQLHKVAVRLCAAIKLTEKINRWMSREGRFRSAS